MALDSCGPRTLPVGVSDPQPQCGGHPEEEAQGRRLVLQEGRSGWLC